MPSTAYQPNQTLPSNQQGPLGQVAWWCHGPEPFPFQLSGCSQLATVKGDVIQPAYCTAQDVFNISVGEDQSFDYAAASTSIWIRIGAAKINEFLGQRFNVPLPVWSDSVVWCNCELAYIGITRKRGINSEALMADFRYREEAVVSWLKMSRDHEVTPLSALSAINQPRAALQYIAQPSQGWGVNSGAGGTAAYSPGAIGRVGWRGGNGYGG